MSGETVEIHTDGGCLGNPGPGAWGAVLKIGDHEETISGTEPGTTTSNKMEIRAAIEALRFLDGPHTVTVFSDSEYLVETMLGKKKRHKNLDMWAELDEAAAPHKIAWEWVEGHAGIEGNEKAHQLVQAALSKMKPA